MDQRRARVLDVGNCDPDHAMIRGMLTEHFDVDVDRVMFVDEAVGRIHERKYDLVLFNRLIFADGSDGSELLRQAQVDPALKQVPIMMISNFAEAQAAAVAAGGLQGFGKAALRSPKTRSLLAAYLPMRTSIPG